MPKYLIIIFILLLLGCSAYRSGSVQTKHTFNDIEYSLPKEFIAFDKGNRSIKDTHGESTIMYVEKTHTDNEPKTGIVFMVSRLSNELLISADCDYSLISRTIETKEVVPSTKRVYPQASGFSVERMNSKAFRLKIETDGKNTVEHQVVVGKGLVVNIIINYMQSSNYSLNSELGNLIFNSLKINGGSVCEDI